MRGLWQRSDNGPWHSRSRGHTPSIGAQAPMELATEQRHAKAEDPQITGASTILKLTCRL